MCVRERERVNDDVSYRHPNEVHFIGYACYLAQKVTVEKQNKLEERILRGNNYQNKYKVPLNFFRCSVDIFSNFHEFYWVEIRF